MLTACLKSLLALDLPRGMTVRFIIVENSATPTLAPVIERFADALRQRATVELIHEPKLGIPVARNRALYAAADGGDRWLVFVDDDETVAPDWLACLVTSAEARGFDLAAGPVIPIAPDSPLSPKEAIILDHYSAEARRGGRNRERALQAGAPFTHDLATNNWIGRVEALRNEGLRFDEAMGHMGGTDTDLSRRAAKAGLTLGWVPEALVYEVTPKTRLTLGYIFRRARSQTLAKYHMRYGKQGRRAVVRPTLTAMLKALSGLGRLAVGYALGSRTQVKGVRALGIATGYLQGVFGRRSTLYLETDGN